MSKLAVSVHEDLYSMSLLLSFNVQLEKLTAQKEFCVGKKTET